ncbi:MAG: hypothetical protein ACE5K7_03740, partial [Phycisphaerae bacterium]
TEYDPSSAGMRDFSKLAQEVLAVEPAEAVAAGETVSAEVMQQADALAAKAQQLLATSTTLLGPEPQVSEAASPRGCGS